MKREREECGNHNEGGGLSWVCQGVKLLLLRMNGIYPPLGMMSLNPRLNSLNVRPQIKWSHTQLTKIGGFHFSVPVSGTGSMKVGSQTGSDSTQLLSSLYVFWLPLIGPDLAQGPDRI